MTLAADIPFAEFARDVPGLKAIRGERWRPAPSVPRALVSSLGRVVFLPVVVSQVSPLGRRYERRLRGRIVVPTGGLYPRIIGRPKPDGDYERADLAREILGAFVRPGQPHELAIRLSWRVAETCRLENLVWSGDRTADLLERFLAGAEACLDAADLELAALRLGVSRSVLCKALTRERRRLGARMKSGPKSPRLVALELVAARELAGKVAP